MQWETLTAPEFERAVRDTRVCILPLGVLERHSDHLPLGTDYVNAHRIACLAAEREPAVVFPPFYFGQIYEARCFPGALTIRPTLLLELLQAVLDEIGRNGLRKIIVYNGHGGNNGLVRFVAQCALWEEKPYALYVPMEHVSADRRAEYDVLHETRGGGHACEDETSVTWANFPETARREAIPAEPGAPLGRLGHLPPTFSAVSWYADYPEHYAGDARAASVKKGKGFVRLRVETLAEYIAAVKTDRVVPALQDEFFRRVGGVGVTAKGQSGRGSSEG